MQSAVLGFEEVRGSESRAGISSEHLFLESLSQYRNIVMEEMGRLISAKYVQKALASRLAEYPLRAGKGLRPALCLATCQAFGGRMIDALQSAVALELFHNAFLVHDDIEDESTHRRGAPTIHKKYGVAIAINVGDALNVLAMSPLLENVRVIGLAKTLRVFNEIDRMARESVEGQAMELEWVKSGNWRITDRDYSVMTHKKTCWYTCIAPCRIGAIIGGANQEDLAWLVRFGLYLGLAFQIRDDLLNLAGEEGDYGKEKAGDIWEGKRTLMLINLIKRSTPTERRRLVRIISKPRNNKTKAEVNWVLSLMETYGCIEYGRAACQKFALKARDSFARGMARVSDSVHKDFLQAVIGYVVCRAE